MKRTTSLIALSLVFAGNIITGNLMADDAKPKAKPYPLKTCVVSGEKLGAMGDPVVFVHEGQEIKLCCKSCRPKFDKDPAKYLKKLEPKK